MVKLVTLSDSSWVTLSDSSMSTIKLACPQTIGSTRLTSPVWNGGNTTGSPSRTGNQDIIISRGSISPQWSRDAWPLYTSINGINSKHRDPAPIFSKVIGRKFTDESSANVNLRCRMIFEIDTLFKESPNLVNLGLKSICTSNELVSVFIPTTRIGMPTDGPNWIPTRYIIGEVTADRVNRKGSEQDYIAKTDFETRR